MERPRLKLKLSPIDYFVEIVSFSELICLIILPIYYFNHLPDLLPKHFNAAGNPDSFGARNTIWVLPAIGLVMYIGLSLLNRFPHLFNYPVNITEENAQNLYTIGTRTVRILKLIIILIFFYITYTTIKIGLKEASGLSVYFLLISLILILTLIVLMIYKMKKLSTTKRT